jgi:adenosine kinase
MSILVCGSMAYDTIMVFGDRFKNHILPDQIHLLNVSFLVPEMRREFGGCAGNIAYNLKLLGDHPEIMATVGHDFDPYARRLEALGLSQRYIRRLDDQFTAQAFITTDLDDNQITAFHPGAMSRSHENRVDDARNIRWGIVSPDGRDGMLEHCRQFSEAGIRFIFDPGQGLPMFTGEDLLAMMAGASGVTLNDYEARVIEQKTGVGLGELAGRVEALVVTRGGEGSVLWLGGQQITIPAVKPGELVDPTGCGDAYRAGLLHGLDSGWTWERSCRLASVMGAIKIEQRGGQNHAPTRAAIGERYARAFGELPW